MAIEDREITLLEPGPLTRDEYGQEIPGASIEHLAWATRRDRGGSEGLTADTQIGNWQTRFRVRVDGLAITNDWDVRDEAGRLWDIESVNEVPSPRRRFLLLNCTSRG